MDAMSRTAHFPGGIGPLPLAELAGLTGLEQLQRIVDGRFPAPPMAAHLDFWLVAVAEGMARFEGQPRADFCNPLGTIHGGWAATLLDSALACAVHTTLAAGEAYTTLEIKVNMVRPIFDTSGPLSAEGTVVHRGKRTATSEARLEDAAGRVFAHGSTTCLIIPVG
nr:PaaI family thioesterase [Amorphus coralli]